MLRSRSLPERPLTFSWCTINEEASQHRVIIETWPWGQPRPNWVAPQFSASTHRFRGAGLNINKRSSASASATPGLHKKMRLTRVVRLYRSLIWMGICGMDKSSAFLWAGRRLGLSRTSSNADSTRLSENPSDHDTTTIYTIDAPPIDDHLLQTTVRRNFVHFNRYLESRPVAGHTLEAFAQFQTELSKSPSYKGLILDSGCGTGRSSLVLGDLYPDRMVVGVDRSIHRLGKIARDLVLSTEDDEEDGTTEAEPQVDNEGRDRQHVQRVRDNVILVRAELVHFWRLWWQQGLVEETEQHYVLYPNPYPKKSRLKQRWYAHPSFPLLLLVTGGQPLIVRTNWEQYAREFADAVAYAANVHEETTVGNVAGPAALASKFAHGYLCSVQHGPNLRNPGDSWTNFEAKYDKIGETTYELLLQACD